MPMSHISNEAKSERARLILKHMPQVKLIARKIHRRLPVSVSLDDMISAGLIGLIAALDGLGNHLKTGHTLSLQNRPMGGGDPGQE
jgi:DNA-directed RNA polymerase specialized sigma subunit